MNPDEQPRPTHLTPRWQERRRLAGDRRRQQQRHAFDLLPEIDPPRHQGRSVVVPIVSLAACVALLGVLFGGFWWHARPSNSPGPQTTVQAQLPTAEQTAFATAGRPLPPGVGEAPVVLAFHDVRPGVPKNRYVVDPARFAQQLQMLRLAGYRSMTADDFLRYTRGQYRPPARSVLITFDDGTGGLYTYADPLLKQNGFTAVSFLITKHVGRSPGYYLSRTQIDRMRGSGRWDFGAHTHDSHTRGPAVDGREESVLTSRQIIDGHRETYAEFEHRVGVDLDTCLTDFTDLGLPRPQIFAWPFSEVSSRASDPRASALAMAQVRQRFSRNFVNVRAPLPVTPPELREPSLQRLEVLSSTSPATLLTQLRNALTVPVTDLRPAGSPGLFTQYAKRQTFQPAPLRSGVLQPVSDRRFLSLDWARQRTATWTDYRLDGVATVPADSNVGIVMHSDAPRGETSVVVSRRFAAVRTASGTMLAHRSLDGSAAPHRLDARVQGTRLQVRVDGRLLYDGRVAAARGGPGLVYSREKVNAAWGAVSDLRVRPVSGS